MRSFLLLGCVLCLCALTHAEKEVKVVSTHSRFVALTQFGFLKHGTIEAEVTTEPGDPDIWFVACDKHDYVNIFGENSRDPCIPFAFDDTTCLVSAPVLNHTLTVSTEVPHRDQYYFIVVNCEARTYTATFDYLLLNPGGEHLGYGYIPLKSLFIVMVVVWSVVILVWSVNWIMNRNQRVKLHRTITLYPFAKIVYSAFGIFYWLHYSHTGEDTTGAVVIYYSLYTLLHVSFFGILLLIASGWGTVKSHLTTEKIFMGGVLFGLAVTLIAGFLLHGFFLMLTFLIYMIIIVMIFRYINANLIELHQSNRMIAEDVPFDQMHNRPIQIRNTAAEKERMFKNFKIILIVYIVSEMVIVLLEVLVFTDLPWVESLLTEIVELMMFICIIWTFRLRGVNIYYQLSDDDGAHSNHPTQIVVAANNHNNNHNETEMQNM